MSIFKVHLQLIFYFFLSIYFNSSFGRDVFIHIGPHKTGTSQLQYNLVRNRHVLNKSNFELVSGNHKNACAISMTLMNDSSNPYCSNQTLYEEQLVRIQQHNSHLILSHESFDRMEEPAVRQLAQLFVNYNVTIVAFHRNRLEWMRSSWCQTNKNRPIPLSSSQDFVLTNLYNDTKRKSFNLHKTLDIYASVFGARRIRVVSFEGSIQIHKSVFNAFIDLLQLPLEEFKEYRRSMNKSPSAVTITAQKQLADFAAMSGLNFTVDVHQSHQILASKISLLPIRTLEILEQSSNCVMSNGIYSRFKILNPLLRKTNISNLEVRLIAFDLFDCLERCYAYYAGLD